MQIVFSTRDYEEETISYNSLTEEATKPMKQRIPEPVVNCFLSIGYGTLGVIAEMYTSSEPGNSLQAMEEFVSDEHPNDHRLTHGTVHAWLLVCLSFYQGTATPITNFLEHHAVTKQESG